MQHLIIYCNHHDESFNFQVKDILEKELIKKGHSVRVRDLYALRFNPVLSPDDFRAIREGFVPREIAREQQYIREADLITLVYPVWWTGMPAILKGYIDRVMLHGFAYLSTPGGVVPLLTGKKVMIFNSMGQSREEYEGGMFEALRMTTEVGIFGFCGMEVIEHVYFPSIRVVNEANRAGYLDKVRSIAERVGCKTLPC